MVCVGRGTKSVEKLQAEDKVYSGLMRLGEHTPSYDRETDVSERCAWQHITDAELQATASMARTQNSARSLSRIAASNAVLELRLRRAVPHPFLSDSSCGTMLRRIQEADGCDCPSL